MTTILRCCVLVGCLAIASHAETFYISSGGGTLTCGGGSHSTNVVSFFNTSGNWANPKVGGKIGPGDTVYLCGTITGTVNTSEFTIPAVSGSNGSPITILADSTLDLNSPAWSTNGAIICNGSSFITLDGGGTGGKIDNTADGTLLANQIQSEAIVATNCPNLIVQNWTITNVYIRQEDNTTDNTDSIGINITNGSTILVQRNTLDHVRVGIGYTNVTGGATSAYEEAHDIFTFTEVPIVVATAATNSTINNVKIHDDDYGGGAYLWDSGSPNLYHHEALHFFSQCAGCTITNVQAYNGYFHGIWSRDAGYGATHITAAYFFEQIGSGTLIFNNVIDFTAGTVLNEPANGAVFCKGGGSGSNVCTGYNNTFLNKSDFGYCIEGGGGGSNSGHIFKNNIMNNTDGIDMPTGSTIAATDFNDFYLTTTWIQSGVSSGSLAAWKVATGFDSNSITTNPKNNSDGTLQAGSPAISTGTNLTSLGITALNSDKNGVARPSVAAWDMGCCQFAAITQASPSTCSPASGNVASTICTNPNGGTTVQCYTTNGTTPATAGNGTSCTTGTLLTSPAGTITLTVPVTVKIIAGTSTLTDSTVNSYTFTTSPVVSLSPSSLNFGNVSVGVTSSPQTVTLTNTGSVSLTVTTAAITTHTQFAKGTDTCTGQVITAGSTCIVVVTFTPTTSGAKLDFLVFTDSSSTSPESVTMVGTGVTGNPVNHQIFPGVSVKPGIVDQ